jgi:hypothetical protein
MSEEQRIIASLQAARDRVGRLQDQLIPTDVQGFIRDDRSDFAFTTKTVCVVAVQVASFSAYLRQQGTIPWFGRVLNIWRRLSVIAAHYPALMRQNDLPEVFTVIAGLFSGDDPTLFAHSAVEFAKEAVGDVFMNETEVKVLVGISAGGPLLCGLSGTEPQRFIASGQPIEDALTLSELSSPNKILVSGAARTMLEDVEFETGGDASRGFFVKFDLSALKRGDSSPTESGRVVIANEDSFVVPEEEPVITLPDLDEGL